MRTMPPSAIKCLALLALAATRPAEERTRNSLEKTARFALFFCRGCCCARSAIVLAAGFTATERIALLNGSLAAAANHAVIGRVVRTETCTCQKPARY